MNVVTVCAFLLFGLSTVTVVTSTAELNLTPYIIKKQNELARNLSRVSSELFLNVTSYSGFFTVDNKYDSKMFFWYFPVQNQTVTKDTPWIVWLQGGPGASSLVGLFDEIGPFTFDLSKGLQSREWCWNRKYPVLFIDNPVGAGFSYTNEPGGYVQNMDDCSKHLYSALQQFLELFPEHRRAPLYLAGESYAGHYLPAFGHRILQPPTLKTLNLTDVSVNLKGIIMGNPVIDRKDVINMTSVYYHWGLIDSQGVEAVRPLQEKYAKAVQENNDDEAYAARNDLWDKLESRTSRAQSYNLLKGSMPEIEFFEGFVTREDVREAIHVGNLHFNMSSSVVHNKLIKDFSVSLNSKVEELLEHYRIMIYCGQLDLIAPCVMNAEARRKNWRWSGRQAFLAANRNPWWYEGVAGYVKTGGNFTEVLVRGAGHLVPMDKPAEAFQLVDFFIRGLDMPLPSNYDEKDNDTPQYLDVYPEKNQAETNSGLIASIVLNVIFVTVIIAGVIFGIRWKRRTDTFFYSMVDNASLDGVLTMD